MSHLVPNMIVQARQGRFTARVRYRLVEWGPLVWRRSVLRQPGSLRPSWFEENPQAGDRVLCCAHKLQPAHVYTVEPHWHALPGNRLVYAGRVMLCSRCHRRARSSRYAVCSFCCETFILDETPACLRALDGGKTG